MKNLIVTLSLVALITGCSTVACHDNGDYTSWDTGHGIFRGVRHDFKAIGEAESEQIMGIPYYAFDMPFSLAGDALLLPLDLVSLTVKSKPENDDDAVEKQTPSKPQ